MRTNVIRLGLLGVLAVGACSPAAPDQGPTGVLAPGSSVSPVGSVQVTPGSGVSPVTTVAPQTTTSGTTTGVGVSPQSTGVSPQSTAVSPQSTGVSPATSTAAEDTGASEPCVEGDNLPLIVTNGNWVGCDPAVATDNPGGVQGAFYLYSDGASCDDTAVPCDATGCHLKGTSIDGDPGEDWGCGLGLGLNTDADEVKHPYTGATCFDVEIAGSTGGLELRIAFTQHDGSGSTTVAPFRSIAPFDDGFSGEVCIADVDCPSWSLDDNLCEVTGDAYDLQIQVAAGEMDTDYDLTLTKLVPKTTSGVVMNEGMGPAMLTVSGSSCDNFHEKKVGADGKEYVLINNVWNSSGGQQCIEYTGTNFKITTQTNSSGSTDPVSFPAAIYGRKAGISSADSGLPLQISAINSIETGFKIKAANIDGTFNAAYDIWVSDQGDVDQAPQYFVMLWPWTQGNVQPAGSVTANAVIEGVNWDIWTGGVGEGNGKYIAYQAASNIESLHVDLKAFFDDAVANRGLPENLYLLNVQAGFEIWNGGAGLESEYFYVNVQ